MRVTDRWRSHAKPTLSFELFPARSEKAVPGLEKAIMALTGLEPDFVSVTFGAGGSTREGSRQLIEALKCTHGLEVMAYFACYGLGPDAVAEVLDDYQALGLENILAVRGDPPQDERDSPAIPTALPMHLSLWPLLRTVMTSAWAWPGIPRDMSTRPAGTRIWSF